MPSILKSLRLAADPTRVRLLLLLEQEELSVAELQDILGKGQSQISTHLAQLKQAGLVDDRRMGKNAFYRLTAPADLMELLRKASGEVPESAEDRQWVRPSRGGGGRPMPQLMAQGKKKAIAADNAEKVVESGAPRPRRHGIAN